LRPRKHLPVVMGRHIYTLVTTWLCWCPTLLYNVTSDFGGGSC
jgi:hypothetical protein